MFTQNQIRQMFVANAYSTTAAEGNISVSKKGTDYKIVHYGKDGLPTIVHIPEDHILYTKAVAAAQMKYTSRASLITLNSNYLVDTNNDSTGDSLVSGQDYILNVRINGLYWDSDEVWGHKYGAVHATYGMSPSNFYIKMALSLAKNLSRDVAPMLKVYVTTSTSSFVYSGSGQTVFEVTADTAESSLTTGTYVGIIIDEVEQPWRLGVMPQHPVEFIANPSTILFSGEEVTWGTSKKIAGNLIIQNSKKIADMEYFYHANRGDYNREAAWPNNWAAAYLANSNAQYGYDVVEIHWYWDGANHAVQKSEKDITIAFPAASGTGECDNFITAWNNLNGVEIEEIDRD